MKYVIEVPKTHVEYDEFGSGATRLNLGNGTELIVEFQLKKGKHNGAWLKEYQFGDNTTAVIESRDCVGIYDTKTGELLKAVDVENIELV